MKEDFLQFIWRFGYFDKANLNTTEEESVKIIHPGHQNLDAGPDFLNGQVQIGNKVWHGQIEIHTSASEWNKHKHSSDPQYDSVILHVVHDHDIDIFYNNGLKIPTIELGHRIPLNLIRNHKTLMDQANWIPCSKLLKNNFSEIKWASWSDRLIVERLRSKISRLKNIHSVYKNDWENTLYIWLAYGFGLRVNAENFTSLAKRIPFNLVSKYRDQPHIVFALFYGAADMLFEDIDDDYYNELKKDWEFLRLKHNLVFGTPLLWKYHRMRPASFPTLRISQFASLLIMTSSLSSWIIGTEDINSIEKRFKLKAEPYWFTHSKFGHQVKNQSIRTGKGFVRQLLVNVIVPYLFFYGHTMGKQELKDKAINWLQQMKAEDNVIIRKWEEEGIIAKNAADTQALYHLKTAYCDQKACIKCSFGHSILKLAL